jgi:hypothetical protein
MWGVLRPMQPSRFIKEIPAKFLQNLSSGSRVTSSSEADESEGVEGFAPGDQVIHQQFGVGTIQKAHHGSFGLTYEVHFSDSDTTRTLVAKFAKLRGC